jgi:hypothetical protein
MNKTHYIILTILLCLFLGFYFFPTKVIGQATGTSISPNAPTQDQAAAPTQGDSDFNYTTGDTWSGPSGNTYTYSEPNESTAAAAAAAGVTVEGSWGLTSSPSSSTDNDKDRNPGWNCRISSAGSCPSGTCSSWCEYDSRKGSYSTEAACIKACSARCACTIFKTCRCVRGSGNQCVTNDDCKSGTTPASDPTPVRYNCNTTTWKCEESTTGYSALSTCQSNCVKPSGVTSCPGGDNCYSCDRSTGECYRNYNGVYAGLAMCQRYCTTGGTSGTTAPRPTTTTTIPPCTIMKFELPKRAWVDIETIASWSTNNCNTAEINCISDNCSDEVQNLSGIVEAGFDKSKNFTIKAPGTYRYELEACGPGPNNCDTYEDVLGTGLEYIEVEALYLPWWQEIIPILPDNLQGFLKGLIN